MTLNLILPFNLRLGGYSIWSTNTSRTIYDQDLGLEHLIAFKQTEVPRGLLDEAEGEIQKQPEGCSDYVKYLKMPSQVLDACKTRLRRARGLVRPGAAGLLTGVKYSRVGSSTWIRLTSIVTTRTTLGLVDVQEN